MIIRYFGIVPNFFICQNEFMSSNIKAIVRAFNDCINCQDLGGLSLLMTEDHQFIDSSSKSISGKQACLGAWKSFFSSFPDYHNNFEQTLVTGNTVIVAGYSTCSDERLAGPAIWKAQISSGLISHWYVFEDTEANRILLGMPD